MTKVKYTHAAIPPKDINLGEIYEMIIQKEKAIIKGFGVELEMSKIQAQEMFAEVK